MLHSILEWFAGLPPAALYLALAFAAGIENVFPPLPSDTVVAFGSFIAARGQASAIGSFVATLAGNLAGAMFMYWVGARYGAERVLRRLGAALGVPPDAVFVKGKTNEGLGWIGAGEGLAAHAVASLVRVGAPTD